MIKLIAGGSGVAGAGGRAGLHRIRPAHSKLSLPPAQEYISLTKEAVKKRHVDSYYLQLLIFNMH